MAFGLAPEGGTPFGGAHARLLHVPRRAGRGRAAQAELAAGGAQVLCATHSPLLAALPGAHLLDLGDWGLRPVEYDELQLVEHWRQYLAEPMRYLRHVL